MIFVLGDKHFPYLASELRAHGDVLQVWLGGAYSARHRHSLIKL